MSSRDTAKKSRAVSFKLDVANWLAFDDRQMRGPDWLIGGRAQSTSGEQRADIGVELGLHEHLGKRRMRGVGGVGREDQLRVRGQLYLASAGDVIRDRYAANLGVILGRHRYFERGGEGAVAADDFRAILGELDFVSVGLDAGWLVTGRPDFPARHVAQENVRAPRVAGNILAPSGHRHLPPPPTSR